MARNKAVSFKIPIDGTDYKVCVSLSWGDALTLARSMVWAVLYSMLQSGAEAVGVTLKKKRRMSGFQSWAYLTDQDGNRVV